MKRKMANYDSKNAVDQNSSQIKIQFQNQENIKCKKKSNKGRLQIRKRLWTEEVQ